MGHTRCRCLPRAADNAALRREITPLSPAAMPFMAQQQDSNVSGEEGARCAAQPGEPKHPPLTPSRQSHPKTRGPTNPGEAAQGLEAPRGIPGQQQRLNNSLLQCRVFEHCQKIEGQHKAGHARTYKE